MIYVQNNGRYSLAFDVRKGNRELKFVFDRRRFYLDTGNIATTGVTALEDADYKLLLKNKRFAHLIEVRELELVDSSRLATAETKAAELEAENAKLKKELAENSKLSADEKTKKELKKKDSEIASLKAQLEKLGNSTGSEAEGF